jgi:macrolide transport system ATP-binding/permease protein
MPDWSSAVRQHLRGRKIAPVREAEIIAELTEHLEAAWADELAAGVPETEAYRQVLARFDWPALAREAASSSPPPLPDRRAGVLAGSLQDARLAFRFLRKDRSFAAIAIGTLSFAIGANTTIFTMADALALRGLPYPGASQLAAIETHWSNQKELEPWTSAPDFFDLRQNTGSFSRIAGISPVWNDVLSRNGSAERLDSLYVSAAFFPLLGVRAALGRTFSESEDNGTHPSNVVVLSDRFWHSHFGGRADVLGQSVELNGNPVTVIGVLPPDFRWIGEPLAGKAADIDIWAPLSDNAITSSSRPSLRSVRFLKVIGRLKTGVSIERASAEVRGLGQTLATRYPGT